MERIARYTMIRAPASFRSAARSEKRTARANAETSAQAFANPGPRSEIAARFKFPFSGFSRAPDFNQRHRVLRRQRHRDGKGELKSLLRLPIRANIAAAVPTH
jgi:hypothetical protein